MQLLYVVLLTFIVNGALVQAFKQSTSPLIFQENIHQGISKMQEPFSKRENIPYKQRQNQLIQTSATKADRKFQEQFSDSILENKNRKIIKGYPIDLLKKCKPLKKSQDNSQSNKQDFDEKYCLISKQEFISKEQIIKIYKKQINKTQSTSESYTEIWIALSCTIAIFAYFYYKMKISLLLNVLEQAQIKADTQINDYEKKLKQFEQLKKIYEIYWDKIVYKNEVDVCYDHVVYQGRFLTQQTFVYAVRLEHADIGTLQYKLSKLLNCSHKRLAKLYYYTKNSQFMFIFTQKITPLSLRNLKEHFGLKTSLTTKKNTIVDIIETLTYLEDKIQLKLVPLESIQLEIITKASNIEFYDYKLNTIPCLFRKMNYNCFDEDFDTSSQDQPICLVRLNVVSLFHLILFEGEVFDRQIFNRIVKSQNYQNEDYFEFLDFILYQAKAIGHTHELLFNQVLQHPFLWDSKRKILFLADFSNYIQTHLEESRLIRFQKHAQQCKIIKPNWIKQFHSIFASQVNFYRKYDFQSVRDLIRMIRNKLNHFHQIPKQVKSHIGKTPQGFIQYCFNIFPKLLPFAYIYTRKKKWKLHMK